MAALQVINFDLQISDNRGAHHTDSYLNGGLIVRRGNPFNMSLVFNRQVTAQDRMQFTARLVTSDTGNSLLENTFSDSSSPQTNSWGAQRGASGSDSMKMTFFTPSNAVIGRYALQVQTNGGITKIGEFILLFNTWNSGDTVYLADQSEREEYVLSEFGLIYMGEPASPIPVPWNYGQFQDNILNIALALMDSTLTYRRNPSEDVRRRNDPLYLCRTLSAIVNSRDDNGVVMGNWSGEYSEGTSPSSWTGSTQILRKWYQEHQPVKYGQCWVFAGVLCTVSRALGLPCRVITNYSSAHDSNSNLSVESYYSVSGDPIDKGGDSIWNFHCWNESWFQRNDLGTTYSGWQIWDSTPQEMSDGIFQLGPASQRAVKEGDVDKSYDTRFVYSEVNADVNVLIEHNDGKVTKANTYTASVGLLICTKAVGRNSLNNITQDYKYGEGTAQEREVNNKALRLTNVAPGFIPLSAAGSSAIAPSSEPEVSGEINIKGTPIVGDDINAILTLKNLTSESKNITANLNATAIVYNRLVRRPVLSNSVVIQLGPNEEQTVTLQILYSHYEKALTTDNMIYVSSVCQVEGWGELFVEATVILQNPPLYIKALGPAVVGHPLPVEVTFTNPLSVPVTDCVLTAEGSGLTQEMLVKNIGVLEPKKETVVGLDLTPFVPGTKQLLVNLTCERFHDVKGFIDINVEKSS
ncbi:protein-glutamine gamma-glutamyltransferase E-like [Spea bombifrons]|uniref:protein-glutamine gamma-glutamyltransferase E-like n=1 Tax=Spea bombifrons TaxID=233779 RepID=UPI00234B0117|nr:protein-glutamine gamma-glutamyltransferase E-like [Spea bombifrons]